MTPDSSIVKIVDRMGCWKVFFFVALVFSLFGEKLEAGNWTGADIGAVGAVGSDSLSSGVYTIAGSGADISGTSDACHYVYQTLTGDGELVVRVASIQNTSGSAKAGIMVRQSLAAGDVQYTLVETPGSGILTVARTISGGATVTSPIAPAVPPCWLEVIKDGTLLSSFQSADGINWTYCGSTRLTLSSPVQIGLAVSSQVAGTLCTATFDNIVLNPKPTFAPAFPWLDQDIGSPGQMGQIHSEQNVWSFYSSGLGIASSSDQFHFGYQTWSGNGAIIARVESLETPNASAGVFIRQDLSAGAAEAGVLLNGSGGIGMVSRATAGGALSSSTGASIASPYYWIKLVRTGNAFSGYKSTDGSLWTLVGQQAVSMSGSVYVGLEASSGSNSTLVATTIDHIQVIPGGAYQVMGGIASGAFHNLYLQANGNVWAWGLNTNGQVGDGTTTQRNSPVPLVSLSGIEEVGAGAMHSVALGGDGTIWTWGNNANGQLGDGSTTQENSPEHLTSLTGMIAVSAGASHTLALANDGTIWVWGNNASGQLGDGTTTSQLSPEHLTSLTRIFHPFLAR